MTKPASYTGHMTVVGKTVQDFERSFNPLNWPDKAPYLWKDVYLIPPVDPPLVLGEQPVSAPPGGNNDATGLPRVRSEDPAKAEVRESWRSAKLFEAALFGGFLYRNVLQTTLVKDAKKISLTYDQVECLDAGRGGRLSDGGIDLDTGEGTAQQDADGAIQVTVSKTVRFTQPSLLAPDINLLAQVMVPLSFDFWLHSGLF
jgi:hypothetical protein